MQAIKNVQQEQSPRGSREYNEGHQRKTWNMGRGTWDMVAINPSQKSYQGSDANAVNKHNGYRMDAVPVFISRSRTRSTNADMTNHLMHEETRRRE